MSNALYRKYRPTSFGDVVGQDHIVEHLKKKLSTGNVPHAHLFFGPRGLGKTTLARILGLELGVSETDLYEIDAASRRRIDDIRELIEAVHTLPYNSPFKLYIIDEVHMLTKESFNALLKTLEEPPAHVKFVLATTEIHKVPDTILSRCEVHTLAPATLPSLETLIQKIVKKEGREIEKEAATVVARTGDGSYRDTLGVLQKVLASLTGGGVISKEQVEDVLAIPSDTLVLELLASIAKQDHAKTVEHVTELLARSASVLVVYEKIISELRSVLLTAYDEKTPERHGYAPHLCEEMRELSKSGVFTLSSLKVALEHEMLVRSSANAQAALELVVLTLSHMQRN